MRHLDWKALGFSLLMALAVASMCWSTLFIAESIFILLDWL